MKSLYILNSSVVKYKTIVDLKGLDPYIKNVVKRNNLFLDFTHRNNWQSF